MDNPHLVKTIIIIAVGLLMIFLINKLVKRNKELKKNLNHRYVLHLIRLIISIVCLVSIIELIDPKFDSASLLIKGSALVVAILGFAAQTAISDIICGFLISFNKPFEVGDRIIVEGLEPGVVEDITLRHTVLQIYDGMRIIVPNSQLNSKTVINASYHSSDRRGIHLKYSVSYETDVQKAMDIIRDCVVSSPYTLAIESNGISEDSSPVYFLEFADSALILETTIWVSRTTSSYTAITDMNMRVNNAFKRYGIEIPYNYVNVVSFEGVKKEAEEDFAVKKANSPIHRHFRTDTVKLINGSKDIVRALEVARSYARRLQLKPHDLKQLELLTEESIGVLENIINDIPFSFWIEGSGYKYRIHLRFNAKIGSNEYRKLLSLSSSGKNDAIPGISGKLKEIILLGISNVTSDNDLAGRNDYRWALSENGINEDEIGESILTSIASDIKVSVTKEKVEFLVIKSTQ